ncbi:putative transmembrane protein [Lasiodiplodia theobromae]|nr:putative transmembrane protein [Lasiodiplodia theobromae]
MDVKEQGTTSNQRQGNKRTSRHAKREIRQKAKNIQARLFNPTTYSRIHQLWFGDLPHSATVAPAEIAKKWFGGGSPADKAAFDHTCTTAFRDALVSVGPKAYPLPPLDAAGNSSYAAELAHAPTISAPFAAALADAAKGGEGGSSSDIRAGEEAAADAALSLVLLLDQLSRNIFRTDQKLIYSHYDRLSRSLVRHILSSSPRADLHPKFRAKPVFRLWFYMPLMHSEFLEDHRSYETLAGEMLAEMKARGDKEAEDYVKQSLDFEIKHKNIIEKFGRYPHRNEVMGRTMTKEESKWLEAGGETFGTGK